jgi:hypothetical protein
VLTAVLRCEQSAALTKKKVYGLTGVQLPRYSSGQALSMLEDFAHQVLPQVMDYEWTGLS